LKEKPRLLLMVDWLPVQGSRLLEALRENGVDCDIVGIDFHPGRWTPLKKVFSFWPRCLWLSLKVFAGHRRYDYVIAWQQVMGMFLGVWKYLTRSFSPRIFILTAVFVERENSLLQGLRRWFIKTSLKKVDRIGFLSDRYRLQEMDHFQLPASKCVTLKYPLIDETLPPYKGFLPDGYLYSVGVSWRDYGTLLAAAKKSPHKFVVATVGSYLRANDLPANVTVFQNYFDKSQEELLEKAAAVVLPLEKTSSPAAEATLVKAMAMGKPVIATKTVTTEEYIVAGETGLLVPWKDPEAIVAAADYLFADKDRAQAMGRNARQWVLKNNSLDAYARKIISSLSASYQGEEGAGQEENDKRQPSGTQGRDHEG
jgi:glycosyltransferase involved in cell wall biosynthesis